jgi:hypothetical protein
MPSPTIGANPKAAELICKYHDHFISANLLGWRGAGDILCDFADRLHREREQFPSWLSEYLIRAARGNVEVLRKAFRKRGQDPYANIDRDFAIATAVRLVAELGGFKPTRNPATEEWESGCSIVAKALGDLGVRRMSERNVEAIWRASKSGRSPIVLVERALARQVLDKHQAGSAQKMAR